MGWDSGTEAARGTGAWAALSLLVAAGACDEDAVAPADIERSDLIGFYSATSLQLQEEGGTRELLAEGVRLSWEMRADGTTAAVLTLPGSGDVGFAGMFSFDDVGDRVTWEGDEAILLADLAFVAIRETGTIVLDGSGIWIDTPLFVALAKEEDDAAVEAVSSGNP